MDYLVISVTSLLVSILTLFSGFGLGTVLMPVFALFFPLPVAIASTAVIHLANNIFKIALIGSLANRSAVIQFGIPAALASAVGAYWLGVVATWPPITSYQLYNHEFTITFLGLTIGVIVVFSSLFELAPRLSALSFSSKYIPIGGALSGFFGGISGNQGILRSAFLIKSGLNKEEFIGTGVVCSVIVDVIRLLVYGLGAHLERFAHAMPEEMRGLLVVGSLTAFLGSYIGSKMIHKITYRTLQIIVGMMLLILGFALAVGIA